LRGYPTGILFFTDATFNTNLTFCIASINPFHFGTWASVQSQVNIPININQQILLEDDPEIIKQIHGALSWLLGCNSTVYDLAYTWINGTFHSGSFAKSNRTMGALSSAPFIPDFASSILVNATYIAVAQSNSQQLAQVWSMLFSQTAVALSSDMTPRQNLQEQVRKEILVARIPKAPLFAHVVSNCLYALLGVVLAVIALRSKPSETKDIKAQLSIAGVVAAAFEDVMPAAQTKDLFAGWRTGNEVTKKVGIMKTGGDWRWRAVAAMETRSEAQDRELDDM